MIYSKQIEFEDVVQADPTLKFFLREATLDFNKLEHQTNLVGSAIVIAINNYLEKKYK